MRPIDPDRTVYIYYLCSAADPTPRYVGSSIDPEGRSKQHFGTYAARWVRRVKQSGDTPLMVVVEALAPEGRHDAERRWIEHYLAAGCELTNAQLMPALVKERRWLLETLERWRVIDPAAAQRLQWRIDNGCYPHLFE